MNTILIILILLILLGGGGGYYYGGPEKPTWFTPPPEMSKMPKPDVLWHTATFAETRFDCGRGCTWSYFFEARRHLLSAPRRDVLDAEVGAGAGGGHARGSHFVVGLSP